MSKLLSRVWSRSSSLVLGSLALQGASFLALLILKPRLSEVNFAFFMTQLSWASIVGSVATFRLELLLFQERNRVDRESLISILVFAILMLGLVGAALWAISWQAGPAVMMSPMAILLALGFGLIEAQTFLCVQLERLGALLVTRAVQAAALVGTALVAWSDFGHDHLFIFYAAGVSVPVLLWWFYAIARTDGRPGIHFPTLSVWKRSLSLTLSTLVNNIYANLAILLASATQSPGFVADFGFVMRLLTGPITLIRQAYGHTYLVDAFRLERDDPNPSRALWALTKNAIGRSVATYIVIMIVAIAVLFSANKFLQISNPQMIFLLAIVTIGQVGVNTVATIRTPLRKEKEFLIYDVLRVGVLAGALTFITALSFDVVFSIFSSLLYAGYLLFIWWRIRAFSRSEGASSS
ncbi:O-antigen/teichoic acid export membrane protein [Sphingopyxis panaciterrae]|uniref:hypothetical protein n=1 Tax=Sphingopyxis panaciterrae TaxID=363841 RepID=UPI001ABA1120|nr:hypothetical protein [Sphingopyxis panaciterrae]NIJ36412.1 O-antigen/teichoic acid export membrane protein [Sphingopyxis panaciterrae]